MAGKRWLGRPGYPCGRDITPGEHGRRPKQNIKHQTAPRERGERRWDDKESGTVVCSVLFDVVSRTTTFGDILQAHLPQDLPGLSVSDTEVQQPWTSPSLLQCLPNVGVGLLSISRRPGKRDRDRVQPFVRRYPCLRCFDPSNSDKMRLSYFTQTPRRSFSAPRMRVPPCVPDRDQQSCVCPADIQVS
ncbi:hypothetical protein K491DRAFT_203679 [Lophiostoma macrostomum CBS 122681]|uniref:Uncharacterized protein n=1 Tax=Lophiostoma macrostomum CBS 122681 TaxID=1314788 RepID=A0A6A6TIV3_9PLEO|nr:hypothetical protein K491DRAFT_203679 [Lophiostoma macrostomum CBS 122681]